MNTLTKQEKIIVALMRGQHLNEEELQIAKQRVHVMDLILKNWK